MTMTLAPLLAIKESELLICKDLLALGKIIKNIFVVHFSCDWNDGSILCLIEPLLSLD